VFDPAARPRVVVDLGEAGPTVARISFRVGALRGIGAAARGLIATRQRQPAKHDRRHGRHGSLHCAPSRAASIAFSASDALAASGPPPWAMSGRPPPPLPPSAATPGLTRSTALRL